MEWFGRDWSVFVDVGGFCSPLGASVVLGVVFGWVCHGVWDGGGGGRGVYFVLAKGGAVGYNVEWFEGVAAGWAVAFWWVWCGLPCFGGAGCGKMLGYDSGQTNGPVGLVEGHLVGASVAGFGRGAGGAVFAFGADGGDFGGAVRAWVSWS